MITYRHLGGGRTGADTAGPRRSHIAGAGESNFENALIAARPADWTLQANCRTMRPVEADRLFFPYSSHSQQAAVDRICGPCPVRQQCYDAGEGQKYGVWGGVRAEHREETAA